MANPLCSQLLSIIEPLDPKAGEINYIVMGEEHLETLVLIPGLDAAIPTFFSVTKQLAEKYKVIVLDQRGHGQSKEVGENYSTEVLARDLKSLLDHLGVSKAHILGHSMGARTATRFSILFPERVKSLILEDMELIRRSEASIEKYRDEIEKLKLIPRKFNSREDLIQALSPFFGEESRSLSFRRGRENPDGTMDLLFWPHVSLLYGIQANSEDLLTPVLQVRVPILVMVSNPKKGTAISAKGLKAFEEQLPQAKIEKFENAGHVIHRDDASGFFKSLTEFISAVP